MVLLMFCSRLGPCPQMIPCAQTGRPWSRLENPPEQVGASPAAWETVFSEFKGVISLPLGRGPVMGSRDPART